MNARDKEAILINRCVLAARDVAVSALDQREANVFQVASSVVGSRFQNEAKTLAQVSERYFLLHAIEKLSAAEVVRNGWLGSLPRFRDMLSQELCRK